MSEEAEIPHPDSVWPEASAAKPLHGQPLAENVLTPPDSPQQSAWQQVLFAPSGLRAGWGLLLFFALIFALSAGVAATVHLFHTPSKAVVKNSVRSGDVVPEKPISIIFREGSFFCVVAFATWIMGRIERRSVGTYGFGGVRKIGPFFAGFAWGAIFLSVLVGALWKAGLLVYDGQLLFRAEAFRYSAIWVLGFLLVGLLEEYLLRGYIQFTLARGLASLYSRRFKTPHGEALGFWTAALILSFVFGLGHGSNPGESPVGLLSAGLIGVIFCLTLWRTGSLWWALGFHTSWDWAQSFLFGVADSGTIVEGHLIATHPTGRVLLSGGATGPEGSIFVLPVLVLVTLIVLWTLPLGRGLRNV